MAIKKTGKKKIKLAKYTSETRKRTEQLINERNGRQRVNTLYRRILTKTSNAIEDTIQGFLSKIRPDEKLAEGKILPEAYRKYFDNTFTRDLIHTPLEEIDEFYKSHHVNI